MAIDGRSPPALYRVLPRVRYECSSSGVFSVRVAPRLQTHQLHSAGSGFRYMGVMQAPGTACGISRPEKSSSRMPRFRPFRLRYFSFGCGLMRLDLRIRPGFAGCDLYVVNKCVHRTLRIVRDSMSGHQCVVDSHIRLETETFLRRHTGPTLTAGG